MSVEDGRRGQFTLIGLAAIALVVLMIVMFTLKGTEADRDRRITESAAMDISRVLEKETRFLEGVLEDAVASAVFEMGQNGGYTLENRPGLKHMGIPYLFYQGHVVNVPTVTVMEDMLAEEVERRVTNAVEKHKVQLRKEKRTYSFGHPVVGGIIEETGCRIDLSVPIVVEAEDGTMHASSTIEFTHVSPLRIGYLRKLAEEYVHNYNQLRFMEMGILAGVRGDARIWEPPGRLMHSVSCENPPFKGKEEMVSPFRENCQLSVARELKRIRNLFREDRHVEWNLDFRPTDTDFTFVADNDKYGYETERIYLVPQMLAPFSPRSDVCISHYEVTYELSWPVRVSLIDLLPTAKVVGGSGSALIKPLEYQFYLEPYLGTNEDGSVNTRAVNESVDAPSQVDSKCAGSCKLDLTFTNSNNGRVWLDTCAFTYDGSKLYEEEVTCGVHTLVAADATDPTLGRLIKRVNLQNTLKETYTIPPAITVEGTVYEEQRTYCEMSGTLTSPNNVPIVARGGAPPAYIEVLLVPLEVGLGDVMYAAADDKGHYSFPQVTPGEYWLVARSTPDADGHPLIAIDPEGRIVTISADSRRIDVLMKPLQIAFVHGKYERVSEVNNAC